MRTKSYVPVAVFCAVAFGLLCLTFNSLLPTTTSLSLAEGAVTQTAVTPEQNDQQLYLPIVLDSAPLTIKLGMHLQPELMQYYTDTVKVAADLTMAHEMGSRWHRLSVPWNQIETAPGVYDWEMMDAVITQTVSAGFQPLAMVWGAPEWAAAQSCGPISDTASFTSFLKALFTRYQSDVNAWEFTNEPDRREAHPSWGAVVGCWGLEAEAYAEQLAIFYQNARQFAPSALVVSGGLAYDGWENHERSFWENILAAGAGQYFDVANIHYYPINLEEFPTTAHKVDEIRTIMKTYGVDHKPIWITETGMWTNASAGGNIEVQKDFIVKEQTRGLAAGVENLFWFDPREREVDPGDTERYLFTKDHEPLAGYATYQFFASKVSGTVVDSGPVAGLPEGFEAYRFTKSGSELYIAWSTTAAQTTVTFNSVLDAIVTDRDGDNSITISSQNGEVSVEVGPLPRYIEFVE